MNFHSKSNTEIWCAKIPTNSEMVFQGRDCKLLELEEEDSIILLKARADQLCLELARKVLLIVIKLDLDSIKLSIRRKITKENERSSNKLSPSMKIELYCTKKDVNWDKVTT